MGHLNTIPFSCIRSTNCILYHFQIINSPTPNLLSLRNPNSLPSVPQNQISIIKNLLVTSWYGNFSVRFTLLKNLFYRLASSCCRFVHSTLNLLQAKEKLLKIIHQCSSQKLILSRSVPFA